MESDQDPTRLRAIAYFEKTKCNHDECQLPDAHDLAFSFQSMTEDARIDTVRSILLAVSAPEGSKNTIYNSGDDRKRARGSSSSFSSTYYAMRGRKLCRDAFLAITQVSGRTLASHISDVTSTTTFSKYRQDRSKGKLSKLGVNAAAAIKFLETFAEMHGSIDPEGRNSSNARCGYRLPSLQGSVG